jgi:large subunit ribosomal protein L9
MKVVLREHVDKLGDRGEIVSVAAGYARNYLIPKRLAFPATPGNLKTLEHQRRVWEVKETRELGEAQALSERLGAVELALTKKAGESGTLYGSVTTSEIAEMLAARGIVVDRRRIVLDAPIKAVGRYEVSVKLHRKVQARIKVSVAGEESEPAHES